ncbi:hypothetical protein MNBD_GAMMA16-1447 [hydrothermal vent metagenome]|uniref:Short chain amide porin n=1 Tax=hydrothermal vent metagenome TaxID=652676 RepID=A0A3B0ZHB3_9ZZZZ
MFNTDQKRHRKKPGSENNIFSDTTLSLTLSLIIISSTLPSAYAGEKIMIDNEKSISLGLAFRSSFAITEDGAPNGSSASKDFSVDNMEVRLDGQFNNHIKATLNAERTSDGQLRVQDAIAKFEFNDDFNLWLGRMLIPSDRANLSGPFYTNVWEYPGVVSRYPSLGSGRDNGLLIWGKPGDGKIVYSLGVFNGHNRAAGGSNDSSSLLYATRVAVNFFDPESAPAYYVSNTYYGKNRVLTLGASYQFQKDGVGLSPTASNDFNGWNIDFLFEDVLGPGVLTVDGAYYKYELNGQVDCGSGEPGSMPCVDDQNMGNQVEGNGYLATLAYLFPQKIGIGHFQPFLRQQQFNRDISVTVNKQLDFGINYIINKHSARISAVYSQLKDDRLTLANNDIDKFVIGFQLQY